VANTPPRCASLVELSCGMLLQPPSLPPAGERSKTNAQHVQGAAVFCYDARQCTLVLELRPDALVLRRGGLQHFEEH